MTLTDPKLSLIFPGQGSQAVGMGAALAEAYPAAKAVFDEVDEALGQNLFALMKDGPMEELTLTANTQPALMGVSIAAWRVLQEEGLSLKMVRSMAGHSLGEYSAYCAASALSLSDTAKLLRIRGNAMQDAVPVGEGGMAAIIGLEMAQLIDIAETTGVDIANDNAPGQVVISGPKDAIEAACMAAKEAGAKRALPLPVSAPFHSSLMAPARERMAEALAEAAISEPAVPVFSNVTTGKITDPDDIRRTLTEQVTDRVRWTDSITAMEADGTDTFLEVGTGKVLTGLVKRIAKDARGLSFGDPKDLDTVRDTLSHTFS